MGLVMLGTPTKAAAELLNFAHQTQHEKVIRAIGLGLGMTMYGLEEKVHNYIFLFFFFSPPALEKLSNSPQADTMIESLTGDKDPVLRYGGQYTIGLAYCGTANNNAVRKLLHVAVSDVSDDVRRAAVTCLGFVMFRQPEQVPRLGIKLALFLVLAVLLAVLLFLSLPFLVVGLTAFSVSPC
jgi:26S proteasome regulatory subunit N2